MIYRSIFKGRDGLFYAIIVSANNINEAKEKSLSCLETVKYQMYTYCGSQKPYEFIITEISEGDANETD